MAFILASLFGILLSGHASSIGLSVRDVTKADVKKLLEAKVSESTIREYVRVHGPMDPLSSDDLVELKAAGGSTELLKALVDSSASAAQYGRVPYRDYRYSYYSPYYSSYYSSYPYFYTHHHDYYPHYLHDFGQGHHYQTHPYMHTFSPHPPSSVHSGHGVHHGGGHGGGGHGGGHH